jgi:hypothetical protein
MENNIQVKASPSQFTYSMQKSLSWEASWFSASQEIPHVLWNPAVHYRIHKCPPPVPVLSQIIPVHVYTSHFLKILINIIFPSMPGSSKWSLSLPQVSPPKPCIHLYAPPYMLHAPSISFSRFDHTNTGWGVQIIKFLIMYFSPLPCYLIPLHSSIHWKTYNLDNYSLWTTV